MPFLLTEQIIVVFLFRGLVGKGRAEQEFLARVGGTAAPAWLDDGTALDLRRTAITDWALDSLGSSVGLLGLDTLVCCTGGN